MCAKVTHITRHGCVLFKCSSLGGGSVPGWRNGFDVIFYFTFYVLVDTLARFIAIPELQIVQGIRLPS